MKIGIMSDMHLGLRQYGLKEREEDFYKQYNRAIDAFIAAGVECVISAGDIFDQPRPSPKALNAFLNGMRKLSDNDISIVNVIGNHSMIQAPDFITADEVLFESSGVNNGTLLDKKSFVSYHDKEVAIFGLPYYFNFGIPKLIEDIDILNDTAKQYGAKTNILVLHQSFKEFCGFSGEKLSIEDINYEAFDLVICGHIHEKKIYALDESTVFLQPGSLERSNIAEARDEENQGKGVFILDTENLDIDAVASGFVRLGGLRKFFLAKMFMDTPDSIKVIENEILEKIHNCAEEPVINLTVHDSSQSFSQLIDMTKDLKHQCLICHFSYVDESEQIDHDELTQKAKELTPRELLRLSLNPMDEEVAQLGLDLFDALKQDQDVSGLLEQFKEKRYAEKEIQDQIDEEEFQQWIQDINDWLDS